MTIADIIKKTYLLPVYFYRMCISPLLPPACRYRPTCSQYCIQAIMTHGIIIGTGLTVFRLLRCNPWGGYGDDPVPEKGKAWPYIKSFFGKKKDTDNDNENPPNTKKE